MNYRAIDKQRGYVTFIILAAMIANHLREIEKERGRVTFIILAPMTASWLRNNNSEDYISLCVNSG